MCIYLYFFDHSCWNSSFSREVFRKELEKSMKLDIDIEEMLETEKKINTFYEEHCLDKGASIFDVAKVLKVRAGDVDPMLSTLAGISEPNADGEMTVNFKPGLSAEKAKFSVAHECAHIINGDPLPNARPEGKNKSKVEQLADYTAAALLFHKMICFPIRKT